MAWFKRQSKGIQTPTEEKKDIPKGLWYKSPTGKIVDTEELQANFYVSPEDDYHVRIGSREYFSIIFDKNFKELDENLSSKDPLKFEDSKKYTDRLKAAKEKTKLNDAIRTAVGKSMGKDIVIAFPIDFPTAVLIASLSFVFSLAAFNLSVYFLLSSNFNGSLDDKFSSNSLNLLSNIIEKYSLLPILTW